MKVLLIQNKDITMEYLEDILKSKDIRNEVIVALPDAFTLEVMRNIHFDMVIGSIQSTSIGVIGDFLEKVKLLETGDDIYAYMAIEKETLSMLNQEFLDVVDDFISLPLDREEFGYRLAKAAKRLMKRRGTGPLSIQPGNSPDHRSPDISSPDVKILDSNLQDISIRDILESERVEPDNMDSESLFLSDENFSFMEAEAEDVEGNAEIQDWGTEMSESEVEQLIKDVLKIEIQPEIIRKEIQYNIASKTKDEGEAETEPVEARTGTGKVGAVSADTEPELMIEPSYDELFNARGLRREKEKAEYERKEKLKWERVEKAVVAAYRDKVVGTVLRMRAVSNDVLVSEEDVPSYHEQVVRAATAYMAEPESDAGHEEEISVLQKEILMEEIPCEPSYEDLLRESEMLIHKEQEEARRQSMSKKFSGFNLENEGNEETGAAEAGIDFQPLAEEHRPSSKAETIQEEIDLLKHLRKDYNVKTSKINTAKFKKEKKSNAVKREKKKNKANGNMPKVSRIILLLLLVVVTTIAILFLTGKFEGRAPIVLNLDFLSNLWGMAK